MIRYSVTSNEIRNAVNSVNDTWLTRANERTGNFIAAGQYQESSSIWSEVKPVYIALQNNKCVFCERKFETAEYGKIEFDLEHFRPKSSIKVWPRRSDEFEYDFPMGAASDTGYFWLAYDVRNYAASCKVCNSTLKSNFFPVAGERGAADASPTALKSEKPYLCYPISSFDDDPEKLVTFSATIAVPAARSGHRRRRGQVAIDFFRLNKRDRLHQERAQMIMMLGDALKELDRGEEVDLNREVVEKITSEDVPHTACSKAFYRLWGDDNALARRYYIGCKKYFAGIIELNDIR